MEGPSFWSKIRGISWKSHTVAFVLLFTTGEFCFPLQVRTSSLDTSKGSFTERFAGDFSLMQPDNCSPGAWLGYKAANPDNIIQSYVVLIWETSAFNSLSPCLYAVVLVWFFVAFLFCFVWVGWFFSQQPYKNETQEKIKQVTGGMQCSINTGHDGVHIHHGWAGSPCCRVCSPPHLGEGEVVGTDNSEK